MKWGKKITNKTTTAISNPWDDLKPSVYFKCYIKIQKGREINKNIPLSFN